MVPRGVIRLADEALRGDGDENVSFKLLIDCRVGDFTISPFFLVLRWRGDSGNGTSRGNPLFEVEGGDLSLPGSLLTDLRDLTGKSLDVLVLVGGDLASNGFLEEFPFQSCSTRCFSIFVKISMRSKILLRLACFSSDNLALSLSEHRLKSLVGLLGLIRLLYLRLWSLVDLGLAIFTLFVGAFNVDLGLSRSGDGKEATSLGLAIANANLLL